MHPEPPRRRLPLAVAVLWVTAVLAVCCSGAALAAGSGSSKPLQLGGTWKGSYSGAFAGTFTIRWTQKKVTLRGSITLSKPRGRYGISGTVRGSGIKFGAVSVGAKYAGRVSTTKMSGTWSSPEGGGSWSAHKVRTPVKTKATP